MLTYIIPIEIFAIVCAIFILMQVFDIKTKDVHVRIKNMLRSSKKDEKDERERGDIKPRSTKNMLRSGKETLRAAAIALGLSGVAFGGGVNLNNNNQPPLPTALQNFASKHPPLLSKERVNQLFGLDSLHLPHLPLYAEGLLRGYLVTVSRRDVSRVIGDVQIGKITAESLSGPCKFSTKCDIEYGGWWYKDVTKHAGPFSIQLNAYAVAVTQNGSSKIFWVQDAIGTKTSKDDGKATYKYYYGSEIFSEIFQFNEDKYHLLPIERRSIEGNGSLYPMPDIYSNPYVNTYIYNTNSQPLQFPLSSTLSIKAGIENGYALIKFQYLKDDKWETFDKVRIGKKYEYRSAYIHIGPNSNAEFGIVGGANGAKVLIKRISDASIGLFAERNGKEVKIRYSYNGVAISSAERDVEKIEVKAARHGMVIILGTKPYPTGSLDWLWQLMP